VRSGLTPQGRLADAADTDPPGYTVTQYREGIEHIDVIARAVPAEPSETGPPAVPAPPSSRAMASRCRWRRIGAQLEYEEPILWRRNRDYRTDSARR